MPPQAYALVTLFALSSVALGWLAVRLVRRLIAEHRPRWAPVLPIAAAFLAFYLIGHRLGLSIGPEVSLFGFQVALVGDLALGFAAALAVALIQALLLRAIASRRQARADTTGRPA
jgi:hypothetical protein